MSADALWRRLEFPVEILPGEPIGLVMEDSPPGLRGRSFDQLRRRTQKKRSARGDRKTDRIIKRMRDRHNRWEGLKEEEENLSS